MSLTVKQALEAQVVLKEFIEKDKQNKWIISSATRIKLALNLRKLNPVADTFTEENAKLVREYGVQEVEPDTGKAIDGSFRVQPGTENYTKFFALQKEALAADSEVELSPVKADDLIGSDAPPVTTNDGTVIRAAIKSNQVPVDLITFLFDVGLLIEEPSKAAA